MNFLYVFISCVHNLNSIVSELSIIVYQKTLNRQTLGSEISLCSEVLHKIHSFLKHEQLQQQKFDEDILVFFHFDILWF